MARGWMRVMMAVSLVSSLPWGAPRAAEPSKDRPLSLQEAYSLSLKQSESLAAGAASAAEVRARVDELRSLVRPGLFLRGSELIREERPATANPNAANNDANRRDVPEAKISLEQPIFSGFRDLAVLRAGKASVRAADAEFKRAEHLLFLDVARAFYDVARLQKEGETRDIVINFTRDRLKEIRERERLGRSRKSERLSVEALVAQLEAGRAQEALQEREAQRALAFLTGGTERVAAIVPALLPSVPLLEDAQRAAVARPDLAARNAALQAAEFDLSGARRAAWPTIDLDGNYYLKRVGNQKNINWDLLFSAELPLYQGGGWSARKAQARARLTAAQAARDASVRLATWEVGAAHDRLTTQLMVLPTLEKAVSLADENAKAQAGEYRLGLVTNLDVLNSLQTLQESRLQREEAVLSAHISAAELAVAQGTLP